MTVKPTTPTADLIDLVRSLGHTDSDYRRLDGLYIYVCEICHHVNHVKRLTCQSCGTIPAEYSLTGRPTRLVDTGDIETHFVEVVNAHGCQRLESRRVSRVYFRTVPADYYATE